MVEYRTKYERELENKMGDKEFSFQNKKRVVVKIGSSSLNHAETGNLNLTKVEHLVRELCDMRTTRLCGRIYILRIGIGGGEGSKNRMILQKPLRKYIL